MYFNKFPITKADSDVLPVPPPLFTGVKKVRNLGLTFRPVSSLIHRHFETERYVYEIYLEEQR